MIAIPAAMTSLPQFNGAQASNGTSGFPCKSLKFNPLSAEGRARCDFVGSPTNLIMVTATSLMLFAGRFGLVPSGNREATAGLKLEVRESGLQTGDPAGFTLVDTLACGVVGHIIGVGVVLGLKGISSL